VAVAYDGSGNPVPGVRFDWSVEAPDGNPVEASGNVLDAKLAGRYKVTVHAAGKDASGEFTLIEPEEAARVSAAEARPALLPYDEWNVDNIDEADELENIRGNSPGRPKGKTNFNIVSPILSLAGRGLNVDLGLHYNSQVWSKVDSTISYDMDKDWLAPGWTTGFGKIVNVLNGGIMQVDVDGTRRFYPGTIEGSGSLITYTGQTNDGSFIKSRTTTSVSPNGQCFYNPTTYLKYPDGTTIWYDVFEYRGCYTLSEPITMVPRRIQDRNGNQITITYHSPVNNPPGRWINTITDTLGRVLTFNYTLDNNRYYLTSITGQGLPDENQQTVTRTFVRLQYKSHTVTHNFTGLTPNVREANIKVLSAIFYPATQSGYWFGDADSYSPYGMIRRVDERRAMDYSEQNGITQGQLTRRRTYSYPDSTTTAIDDIPEFETVTESWEGMTTAASTTTYGVNWDANPRTTETVASDGTKVRETSFNLSSLADTDPEKARDGLTYKTEVFDPSGNLRSKNEIDWELGYQINDCTGQPSGCVAAKVPRPKKIIQSEIEGDITLTKTTVNDFGQTGEYNQVLEMKEYGYGGQPADPLRRTVNQYISKGDSFSTNPSTAGDQWEYRPRLISLPTISEVFDEPTNTRLAYTKKEYDLNALQNFSGADLQVGFCWSTYCNSITDRGNLSKTTNYENAALSPPAELSDNLVYDKAGNLVEHKPEVTTNTLNKYKYTDATLYAYPEEIVTSSDSTSLPDLYVKSTATYNFNTGFTLTAKDSDQQQVEYKFDPNSWRLKTTLLPTGGSSTIDYDDVNRSYQQNTLLSTTVPAGKQKSKINGLGLVYRKETFVKSVGGQDLWDVVEIEYDQLGRVKRTSSPFRSDESAHGVYWSEVFYDGIGRPWKTVAPDGSTKYEYYNQATRPQFASSQPGNTVLMKDPIGREKWHRTDSDGNVVEVVEPDPNGNGSVAANGLVTTYTYDKLKRLTQTNQGSQTRKFRYDSLGRLIAQKMAETRASLDDSGGFVGGDSGMWSDFYIYDKLSNIVSHKDARGVTTSFSYTNPSLTQFPIDPLNRLFEVSYSTNGATEVLPSPTVNYTYPTSGNLTKVDTVTAAGRSTVDLDYDTRGRVSKKTTTITTRPSQPLYIDYTYDNLNRVTDIEYPNQYGAGGARKKVHYDFDDAGRTSALKVGTDTYASDFDFNNFGQVKSVKIGPSGSNQITESYDYDPLTGLLTNQKALKAGSPLLDLTYSYIQCSCSTGGSGQVTSITDNLDGNKNKAYEYDTLGRLKKVIGGANKSWAQVYSYDRYGNRLGVTSLGIEALRNASAKTRDEKGLKSEQDPTVAIPSSKDLLPNTEISTKISDRPEIGLDRESTPEKSRTAKDKRPPAASTSPDNSDRLLTPNYVPFDFDNDDKADLAVFRRSNSTWYLIRSSDGQMINSQFGATGDQIAPGDYDGDGKADLAVWRPSTGYWYLQKSTGSFVGIEWGQKGDSIMPADYDGDGITDLAVWRPSTNTWYVQKSSDSNWIVQTFGEVQNGDIPVAADYDGDNKADIAVWRPSNGNWYLSRSSLGYTVVTFGEAGDVPVSADYDNDGKADLAVWRPSTGVWYVVRSSNGSWIVQTFGTLENGDLPVPADYDGDGNTDIAVWRPSNGTWYLSESTAGYTVTQWGVSGDVPVPSAFRRRSSASANQNQPIPRDGLESLSYDSASNRITTSGFTYDLAGNQTRSLKPDGSALRYQYDAAGRLAKVKDDNQQVLATYFYSASRERLYTQNGNESSTDYTYYAWEGERVISEYSEGAGSVLIWAKNYIFMGGALLATHTKTATGEKLEFTHSDRLGTRMVTNPADGTLFEQTTLPFGTALESESSGSMNRRFTSYDRSSSTGLDYAINRFYDSVQGRFTQVDPITFSASNLLNPQTLNLYAYTANDPVNRVDPDGKFWGFLGAIFGFLAAFIRNTNFSFNFNFGGLPFGFGFQGHFKNIYVGVAGFTVQVTGRGSIFELFGGGQTRSNQQLFDEAVGTVKSILQNPASSCSQFFGAFGASAFQQMIANVTFAADSDRNLGIRQNLSIPVFHPSAPPYSGGPFVTGGTNSGLPNFGHPFVTGGAYYGYFAPSSFVVNTNGPFIRQGGNVPGIGNYPSGSLQSRVLQLLHELGHVTITGSGFTGSGLARNITRRGYVRAGLLLEVDSGSNPLTSSGANTREVLKHCKGEIDALGN
jgi:RHS repeat-associated protein